MVSDNEKILKKLKNVGNPIFLLRLINSTNKFITSHQVIPKAKDSSRLFVGISGRYFEYKDKKLQTVPEILDGYSFIKVSQETVDSIAKIVNADGDDLNKLFKELRKVKNIKKYQMIFEILDSDFELNLQLTQLIKYAF